MRHIARGVVNFVVGDDVLIAVGVLVLLVVAALVVRLGSDAWWLLPIGVPGVLWVSLLRARREARGSRRLS